jgi:hypothetical protein
MQFKWVYSILYLYHGMSLVRHIGVATSLDIHTVLIMLLNGSAPQGSKVVGECCGVTSFEMMKVVA